MTDKQFHQRFDALLREHRKIVFKVAAIYAHSPEDRNDLAQEIRTQLWRSFTRYDKQQSKFSTWMYRVALNVAISQARREHGAHAQHFEQLGDSHVERISDTERIAEQDERLQTLYAFIGQLDALNRALILLYLEERSYAEIADILGISATNVATKINRIKHKLRSQMMAAIGG